MTRIALPLRICDDSNAFLFQNTVQLNNCARFIDCVVRFFKRHFRSALPHAFIWCWSLAVATGALAGSPQPQPATAEPIVLFQNNDIAACGFRAATAPGALNATADVTAVKDGRATFFLFSIQATGADAAIVPLESAALLTSTHDTAKDFSKLLLAENGRYEARARLEGFSGASFMQGIMVGGTITIKTTAGEVLSFALPAPMPQNVRAAYLNCAGDLFRPDNE
jgi:hypothetical protein